MLIISHVQKVDTMPHFPVWPGKKETLSYRINLRCCIPWHCWTLWCDPLPCSLTGAKPDQVSVYCSVTAKKRIPWYWVTRCQLLLTHWQPLCLLQGAFHAVTSKGWLKHHQISSLERPSRESFLTDFPSLCVAFHSVPAVVLHSNVHPQIWEHNSRVTQGIH